MLCSSGAGPTRVSRQPPLSARVRLTHSVQGKPWGMSVERVEGGPTGVNSAGRTSSAPSERRRSRRSRAIRPRASVFRCLTAIRGLRSGRAWTRGSSRRSNQHLSRFGGTGGVVIGDARAFGPKSVHHSLHHPIPRKPRQSFLTKI